MNTATLKPVFALCALLLSASPMAGEHQAHGACPHHSNVDGQACSHHGKACKHGKHGDMNEMRERLDKLDLSDTQRQEMGSLFAIYEPRVREVIKRGQQGREALVMATPGSNDYNNLISAVSLEASVSAGEMVVLLAELQANAYALLTDEQQQKYQALKQEARDKAAAKMKEKAAKKDAEKAAGSAPRRNPFTP
ncbi:MAG: hypothetical protein HKN56_08085 [Gammaproteobacteria bacterium]|nr:hypothetical protein [Gammaproteobacteria bacterium]